MKYMRLLKLLGWGLLSWLVPFLFAFLFFDRAGNITIEFTTFKTIMIICGSLVGSAIFTWLMVQDDTNKPLQKAFGYAVYLFAINALLDILILLPFANEAFDVWLLQTGLRYLIIIFFGTSTGFILQHKLTSP